MYVNVLDYAKGLVVLDKWLSAYLIFVGIDLITGMIKAYKTEGFKSRKLRDGLLHVVAELLAIVFATVLDYVLNINILVMSMKLLLVWKEAVSIVENLGLIGVQIPTVIKNKIQDLNSDNKEE